MIAPRAPHLKRMVQYVGWPLLGLIGCMRRTGVAG